MEIEMLLKQLRLEKNTI